MDLAKLVVALGLAILLSVFIGDFMALVYPIPTMNSNSYSSVYSNTCSGIVESKCGTSASSINYTEYYRCQSFVYSSQEYKDCTSSMQNTQKDLQNTYANGLKTYQIVTLIIYGLVGLLFIILGFWIIRYRSIGAGLIFGGVFVMLVSGVYSILFSVASSFSGILSVGGISGKVDQSFNTVLHVIRLVGEMVTISLIILLSYLTIEKENSNKDGYQV